MCESNCSGRMADTKRAHLKWRTGKGMTPFARVAAPQSFAVEHGAGHGDSQTPIVITVGQAVAVVVMQVVAQQGVALPSPAWCCAGRRNWSTIVEGDDDSARCVEVIS